MQAKTFLTTKGFEYMECDNKELFREEAWTIERVAMKRPHTKYLSDPYASLIKHECNLGTALVQVCVYMNNSSDPEDARCWRCHTPMPRDIQTIWTMLNWEAIQREKEKEALSQKQG